MKDGRVQAAPLPDVVAHVITDGNDAGGPSEHGADGSFKVGVRLGRQVRDETLRHNNGARGVVFLKRGGQKQDAVLADERPIRVKGVEALLQETRLLLCASGDED